MLSTPVEPLTADGLEKEIQALGLPQGAVVIVHSSLSAIGAVKGGASAVVKALRLCIGNAGTLVVSAFTPQVSDPHPQSLAFDDPRIEGARRDVPLFHDALPTPMGAVSNAVLACAVLLKSICAPELSAMRAPILHLDHDYLDC